MSLILAKKDRQQATGNRQQATGNRQQATGNRQQAIIYIFNQSCQLSNSIIKITSNKRKETHCCSLL